MSNSITDAGKLVTSTAENFDSEVKTLLEMIRSSMRTMDTDIDNLRHSFLREIKLLAETVTATRVEILNLKGEKDLGNPIPDATDELDAIVAHTAAATETILDACEQLDSFSATLPDGSACGIQDHTIRIYEACSFQDLTGQRISKVVNALKVIEARIEALTGRYGMTSRPSRIGSGDPLLNGPQAAHLAISQDEIDKLLTF